MREVRLELTPSFEERILNPSRIPFRHSRILNLADKPQKYVFRFRKRQDKKILGVLFAKEQCGLLRDFYARRRFAHSGLTGPIRVSIALGNRSFVGPSVSSVRIHQLTLIVGVSPGPKRKETETAICPSQVGICKEDFTSLLRFKLKKFSYQICLS